MRAGAESWRGAGVRWPACIAGVALLSFALNVAIGVGYGIPKPGVHDEFAYLLMGDTFAQGRLTNPTHPMWPHFETYHVFHRPTYQAKYPPGQGLFLAAGQAVGELPILGVWASLALLCAATCWMLGAVVPRAFALLGGILLAANPHAMAWWGQSYWGGAVAALGGALLFGALFRFQDRLLRRDAIALAAGLALLANSRPFEGSMLFLLTLPLLFLTTKRWLSSGDGARLVRAFAMPLVASLLCVALLMLYYNYRITGEAFLVPYLNWHPEASPIESLRNYRGPAWLPKLFRLERAGTFFIAPPILFACVLGLWAVLKDARARLCLIVTLVVGGISLRFTDTFPHYLAPLTGLILAVVVKGLQSLAGLRLRGRSVGAVLVAGVLIGCFVWDALYLRQLLQDGPLKGSMPSPRHWDVAFEAPAVIRESMVEKLERQSGKHLVLVDYGSKQYEDRFEWIYNAADIDGAEVVWARKLSKPENKRLFAYFKDRQVWLLDPDSRPLRLDGMKLRP